MGADLHLHTTASDGRLTPTELVQRAAKAGLKVIAITDHDTVDGIPEALAAAKAFPSLTVIPGVELSTDVTGGEVHVLGYFIDYHSQLLREKLALMRDSRETRARKMVEKLGKMGMPLRWERVLELAGEGSIGRPHIAQAMLEAGYIASMKEAFLLYISRTGPAYVEREKLTPAEAADLVVKVGGLPVLAHPMDISSLEGMLAELKPAGLVGMEVYYADYGPETVEQLLGIAERWGLIPCGGSDFHGIEGGAGAEIGSILVPLESAKRLMALAARPAEARG